MRELALFAGAGGGILGGHILGWTTVCAVERDAYAAQVLAQRQTDRILKPFPIWSDVTTFDARAWRGIVNVVSGGFPCQDISVAGAGAGLEGERSGLWSEFKRIVRDVEPDYVYVENSPALTFRGLGVVLRDLAEMGFHAEWGIISAADAGAPHLRERIWIMAYSDRAWKSQSAGRQQEHWLGIEQRCEAMADTDRQLGIEGWPGHTEEGTRGRYADRSSIGEDLANALRQRQQRIITGITDTQVWQEPGKRPDRPRSHGFGRWPAEPGMGRVADGVAHRVDRIKALGNGQVPRVAAAAWEILK